MVRQNGPAAIVLLAAVVCCGLGGCTGPASGTGVVEGGPVAYVTMRSDGGDGALLDGTVTVTGACLLIVDDLGQTWQPVFQRPRTTWDGTTLTYSGEAYADGSRIRLGGGGSENADSADYAPQPCAFDYAFYVGP